LNLNHNLFRAEGYRALARSPHLEELKSLTLNGYDLRSLPEMRAELDARFGKAVRYDWCSS
jgi:hypothetical protein